MEKLQKETADFLGENFNPLEPRNKNKKDSNKNDENWHFCIISLLSIKIFRKSHHVLYVYRDRYTLIAIIWDILILESIKIFLEAEWALSIFSWGKSWNSANKFSKSVSFLISLVSLQIDPMLGWMISKGLFGELADAKKSIPIWKVVSIGYCHIKWAFKFFNIPWNVSQTYLKWYK